MILKSYRYRLFPTKSQVHVLEFKGRGRYDSITYPQSGFGLSSGKLHLSKIGDIKIKLHRPIEGKIKTCTIRRMPTGKWFACFSVDMGE